MKRLLKTKKHGFTLVEMVLVIAIIVILASVLVLNVSGYVTKARSAASSLQDHHNSINEAVGEIEHQKNGN